ncbi:MAG: mannose-1-phosphate guanylyltransferase [Bacteroidota bacterium]|nr:mannose-1-phosphate guanylyltransferase [Bacteroidota bacterium]
MVYSVIMAGGIGSRFWPRSREASPKQFLRVVGEETLLQQTLQRVSPLIPADRAYVITHERYADLTHRQLPGLESQQIMREPISRNTACCITYAAIRLLATDPEAVMVVLPADHLIEHENRFLEVLAKAIEAARVPDTLVTIGIKPTHPATGYGYIQFDASDDDTAHTVRTFAEKPDISTAERFLDSGDFLWNSGIFVWRADAILANIRHHLPRMWEAFKAAAPHMNTPAEGAAIRKAYHRSPRISIDYGVMERAENVRVVPGSFGWSDIGDWHAVYSLSRKNRHGNVLSGHVIVQDSSRCLVSGAERLIAVVGLNDIAIIDTEDALLVCHMDSTQQVKNVVDYLHAQQFQQYM